MVAVPEPPSGPPVSMVSVGAMVVDHSVLDHAVEDRVEPTVLRRRGILGEIAAWILDDVLGNGAAGRRDVPQEFEIGARDRAGVGMCR